MRMSQAWGVGGGAFQAEGTARQRAQQGREPEVGKSWGQPRSRRQPVCSWGWESKRTGGEVLKAARGMDSFSKVHGSYRTGD